MKKNMFKKFIGFFLAIVTMFSTTTVAFANEMNTHSEKNDFDKSQIMQLEPYITAENGFYEFDIEKAIEDGFSEELVYGQKAYLDKLNNEVKQGNITVSSDLKITTYADVNESTIFSNTPVPFRRCPGRNTSIEYHWWGYFRYANYCESRRIVSDLNTAAATGTMVGGAAGAISIVFPLAGVVAGGVAFDAGYWWLVATRIDANNHGRGVHIAMTWALVFDITPQ